VAETVFRSSGSWGMTFICGPTSFVPDHWPDPALWFEEAAYCCYGRAVYDDPSRCSDWEPIFDLEQNPVVEAPADCRTVQCKSCAYRVDSPERQGDEAVQGNDYLLESIVRLGQPFWCHQGIRRPIAFVHAPTGIVVPGEAADYRPPMREHRPYKADGIAADICAGWAARRLKYVARTGADA
jgi:hypothetical protein